MPNGGENENPIETIDATKQPAEKSAVLLAFRNVSSGKYDAVC